MNSVMLATFKENELTPFTFEEAEEAIRWALSTQLGHKPDDEVVALALAKIFLETGRLESCHDWNVGNIKASPSYVGMYTAFACNEILNGHAVWFSPYGRLDKKGGVPIAEFFTGAPWHPQTRFRAYANHFDGMDQYVTFIATGRYKVAWARLLSGDAVGFVHELKLARYFTADEALYLKGVRGLYTELLARVQKLPHEHLVPEIDHALVVASIRGDQFAHVNDTQPAVA